MTTPNKESSLLRLVREIVFVVAMFLAILLGVQEGLAMAIPAGSCAGRAVADAAFIIILISWGGIAFPKNKPGFSPLLRLGAVMLGGTLLALLIPRLAIGCTALADWTPEAVRLLEILIVAGVSVPLATLHRRVIEPRWSQAAGNLDGRDQSGEKET